MKAGIVPHEIRIQEITNKNENHTSSISCSTRTPSEIAKAETLRPSDSGFLPLGFVRGFWFNRIPHSVFLLLFPVENSSVNFSWKMPPHTHRFVIMLNTLRPGAVYMRQ